MCGGLACLQAGDFAVQVFLLIATIVRRLRLMHRRVNPISNQPPRFIAILPLQRDIRIRAKRK